ncbi:MAG: NADH-quinone oxidoreductase subunit J family protein [Chloroflexus sp.]|jgi:NADH-quinone oxidoreductase subunit J|uniref:NADH-quinone oxidoreductase subunit J n=1 Tax=Chloroflexus aurantiacus (strain ATCC 29366 / DSM 635 / J-10-fl) TaxID=324602 RepID=A9WFC0_CHLAA|nr:MULTISPECIES: NADH-quinone oxidoreductase subunit J [Chloroflexus]ABY36104.1 NADH-ubiquinone/plastoquinone oxidoreductase chain 6 [Chloroflexus aurantiacus J-10-fl]RMG51060.1 MAG: NADH-quinone oxidoreductase subunit J [Chloroflexota bacterium]GIV91356.1 MAG: NADH-quinone oxidoreductase subunit J [Chloroflexus sp.]HBW66368.1 NADH-quinone oxidoreductase subunit J [Chloroflexus aurantiacus]
MELILFLITALIAIIGAVAMLVSRNAVHSALFLLLNFAAIAVLFLLLNAPFLFAIQLTVYAGAIMVLFLFVVMLLGAEKVEDTPDQIPWQQPLALLLGLALLVISVVVGLGGATNPPPESEALAQFSDPQTLGALLFTDYLLPFEVTGFILLIAVIGVVVLNQRGRKI